MLIWIKGITNWLELKDEKPPTSSLKTVFRDLTNMACYVEIPKWDLIKLYFLPLSWKAVHLRDSSMSYWSASTSLTSQWLKATCIPFLSPEVSRQFDYSCNHWCVGLQDTDCRYFYDMEDRVHIHAITTWLNHSEVHHPPRHMWENLFVY